MGYRKWTDRDLEIAVKTSQTKTEVVRKLGLNPRASGNFQCVDSHLDRLNLDVSHFHQPNRFGGSTKKPLDQILIQGSAYTNTSNLKKRLLREEILKNECYRCGLTEWLNQPISLQLDHEDGCRPNNTKENLRLLCPNCHSQTPTYSRVKTKSTKEERRCLGCGKKISPKAERCPACDAIAKRGQNVQAKWPTAIELRRMVSELGFLGTGRELGVSDTAVRKHLRTDRNDQASD